MVLLHFTELHWEITELILLVYFNTNLLMLISYLWKETIKDLQRYIYAIRGGNIDCDRDLLHKLSLNVNAQITDGGFKG